jgi:trans-aconitate 2-methyltransferase
MSSKNLADQNEKSFQWDSSDYSLHSSAQLAWAVELIDKMRLTGRETVLDIGCGDGKVTALLAERVHDGRVTGVDLSGDMIAFARKSFADGVFPNLEFMEMDARKLDFENCIDAAFSNAALHWIKDHRPVLAGVRRALKPGGRLLFQMGGKGNASEILNVIDGMKRVAPWREWFVDFEMPYGFWGPEEYESWLKEAELAPRRIELIPKTMVQPDREGLAGWIRTTWLPYLERVPDDLKTRFIDEIIDRHLETHPSDVSGAIRIAMVRLEVEATKPATDWRSV